MDWKLGVVLGAALAAGGAQGADADEGVLTNSYFAGLCDGFPRDIAQATPSHMMCLSYIRGFIEGAQGVGYLFLDNAIFCFPNGANYSQAVFVYLRWIEEHPELLHEDAGPGIIRALGPVFRCNNPER